MPCLQSVVLRATLAAVCFSLFAPAGLAQHYRLTRLGQRSDTWLPWESDFLPDQPNYLYVSQARNGLDDRTNSKVRILDLETRAFLPEPFLELGGFDPTLAENAMRGLAFDPNYEENGYVYVHSIQGQWTATINRFTAIDDLHVDPDSKTTVLTYEREHHDHISGDMAFGPDGMLYILSGDGLVNSGVAQQLGSPLGKLLRIDVSGDDFPEDDQRNYAIPADNPFVDVEGALPEIWDLGLRNPWSFNFDRDTGDLYIGDVGFRGWEEINFHRAGDPGGKNFGWSVYEGDVCAFPGSFGNPQCDEIENTGPAFAYPHDGILNPSQGYNSITLGGVYRGPIEELQGKTFFTDYVKDNFYTVEIDRATGMAVDGTLEEITNRLVASEGYLGDVIHIGEDAVGNFYIMTQNSDIYVIEGLLLPGDASLDDRVDLVDFNLLKANFGASGDDARFTTADFNGDYEVSLLDFNILKANFGAQAAVVPEPSGLLLLVLAGGGLGLSLCVKPRR